MPSADLGSFPVEGGQPFIFVSYARADRDVVYAEIKRLEGEGYSLWYDMRDIPAGRAWLQEISRAIEGCSCFIMFTTQSSVDSKNVLDEIELSMMFQKPSLFIHWEEIDIEKTQLPEHVKKFMNETQALLFYHLHRFEYERQMKIALAEFVGEPKPVAVEEYRNPAYETIAPPPTLTRAVFFTLSLLTAAFSIIAIVVLAPVFLTEQVPGDPLSHLGGIVLGVLCIGVAILVGSAAFAVHRIYLRRNHG
jgi:hypothetical protein